MNEEVYDACNVIIDWILDGKDSRLRGLTLDIINEVRSLVSDETPVD